MAQLRAQGVEAIVCAMSGNFVQRGDMAVVNKFARSEMAVRCGADLVLEIPTPWACATAETFARGGVQLLNSTGVVTELAFGSECGDLEAMQTVADVLRSPQLADDIRRELASGVTYALARQQAVARHLGETAQILRQSNNILGIEYLKALAQEASPLRPITVSRLGAGHDDGAVVDGIASGSYVRRLLYSGQTQEALALLPPVCGQILQRELSAGRAPVALAQMERAILSRLRQMPEEAFARYDSGAEGLYHRLYKAVRQATSLSELYDLAKTKRYAHARLRRMVLAAFLEMDAIPSRPPYLRVLAANETGRQLLRQMQKQGAKVLTKPADVAQLGEEAEKLFAAESRWTDLYTLAYPSLKESVCGSDWRYQPIML